MWAGLIWLRRGTGCGFCTFKERFKRTFDLFKSEQNYYVGLFFELSKYSMVVSLNHQYRTNKRFAENCVLVVEICHLIGSDRSCCVLYKSIWVRTFLKPDTENRRDVECLHHTHLRPCIAHRQTFPSSNICVATVNTEISTYKFISLLQYVLKFLLKSN